jgi:sigma-E factor negative regulatory protein RseB
MILLTVCLTLPVLTIAAPQTQEGAWTALQKAQHASQRLSYQGVLSIQSGRYSQSSRVVHVWDAQQGELESLETLDGQPVEWIRRNDEVQCIAHESKTVRMEKRSRPDAFSDLLSAKAEELADFYTLTQKEIERVAGLDSQVFELRPKDGLRYGHRFWIDKDSGLLVKAQTLDETDTVLEQVAFSEIKVGSVPEKSKPRFKPVGDGWKLEKNVSVVNETALANFTLKYNIPGFRRVSEMARRKQTVTVSQFVYSDGLASVSLFVEPFDASKPLPPAVMNHGAVKSQVRKVGDFSVTVMGEVPLATIKQFIAAVEVKK